MKTFTTLLCIVILFLSYSCNKISGEDTYNIKGKMLQDCSGAPYVNYSLRLFYKGGGAFGASSGDVATTTTDADGNFIFTNIPTSRKQNLYLAHDIEGGGGGITWENSFTVPPYNIIGETYDMGVFYGAFVKSTVAKIAIDKTKFKANDTLYFGSPLNYQIIFPIPASVTIHFSNPYSIPSRVDPNFENFYPINWGKGKFEFDSVYNVQGSVHLLKSKAFICTEPDTTYFNIP